MAMLIVKSPYIKCGGEKSAGGYLKYIATRERVEIIPDDRPPTNKQNSSTLRFQCFGIGSFFSTSSTISFIASSIHIFIFIVLRIYFIFGV